MSTKRVLLPSFRRLRGFRMRLITRRLRSEGGFTLIELMIASGVIATSLATLAGVMTSGLSATGYARERQAATQLANQTIEQLRALPITTLQKGLASTDLSGDTSITSCSWSTYCYGGEKVASHPSPDTNLDRALPLGLYPHVSTAAVGPTTYTISFYITDYCPNCAVGSDPDTASTARRATTTVTWRSALKGNTVRNVQVQTIINSSACPVLTHPYSGPCVSSFNGVAQRAPATATITGTLGGVALDHATLSSGRATSDSAIEQIWRMHGSAQAAGGAIQFTGGNEQTVGQTSASSNADNDPDSTPGVYDLQSFPSTASNSATISSGSTSVTATTAGGGTGSTTSTTSACSPSSSCTNPTSATPRSCAVDQAGATAENDLLPCARSSVSSGAVSAQTTLGSIGPINLASIGALATPSVSVVDRKKLATGTSCLATIGSVPSDGCLHSQLWRTGATLSAGGIPSLTSLLGSGLYFIQIGGLTDSVGADSGVSPAWPTATQSGMSITYMTSATLSVTTTLVAGMTIPALTLPGPNGTSVTLSASVTAGSTACSTNGVATACNSVATPATSLASASATSTPPTVTVTYSINGPAPCDTAGACSVTTVLNPGPSTATTSYVPAQTS